mgnify:CR=1 FL=1|jgi:thioredoxin 1|tara:strand:- start:32 stop:307 length:276 start_codon:yes stop_codon:yes gene_type:complete
MKDVIKFYADWCGPCKTYTPFFNEVKEELKENYNFVEVDVDNDVTGIAANFKIMSIPATVVVNEEGAYNKKVGLMNPSELKKFIKQDVKKT